MQLVGQLCMSKRQLRQCISANLHSLSLWSRLIGLNSRMWQTTTETVLWPFVRDYPGKPVSEGWNILDFTEAEMMGWQWHRLHHMQVICTSLQTDNCITVLWARCFSCCPANSVKALKAWQSMLKLQFWGSWLGLFRRRHRRCTTGNLFTLCHCGQDW